MAEPVEIQEKDCDGFTLSMVEYNGRRYPRFPTYKSVLPTLTDTRARPDDILIVTYPKSGTTWTRALVQELVKGTLNEQLDLSGFLEMTPSDNLEKLESPRVLYTHITPDALSTDFINKQCKTIFVVRNIKDVIVSLYHHSRGGSAFSYDGTFSGYIGLILSTEVPYGPFYEHLKCWQTHFDQHPETPVLFLQYENMKENCLQEVKRIRDFIGGAKDDEFCQQVVERYAFENMQTRDYKSRLVPNWNEDRSPFFRKGEVGDWKNWFTVAQSEQIDELCQREMQGSNHVFRYEL